MKAVTTIPPKVRIAVLTRDQGCVALRLDPKALTCQGSLELDHVRGQSPIGTLAKTHDGGFGRRPPHIPSRLVTLCRRHHQGGWAVAHRPLLREYLRESGDSSVLDG